MLGVTSAAGRTAAVHPGVLDVRGRRDFSRFDPRPQSPHSSNFGAMSGVV